VVEREANDDVALLAVQQVAQRHRPTGFASLPRGISPVRHSPVSTPAPRNRPPKRQSRPAQPPHNRPRHPH
jgi:hypothetical protein